MMSDAESHAVCRSEICSPPWAMAKESYRAGDFNPSMNSGNETAVVDSLSPEAGFVRERRVERHRYPRRRPGTLSCQSKEPAHSVITGCGGSIVRRG
ncbi:hypothetical protein KCP70_08975 [Salmonella enterica subsp. enterica]|nr:hypothetical protein KCP70_08975 [Salmonella enterica subsp. enterica]